MSLIKRTPADAAFSDCVRERAEWTCEKCLKLLGATSGLHCAHIYSRRHKSIRHHADNAVALCFPCHQWGGGNPLEFSDWIKTVQTEARLEMLRERKNMPIKYNKALDKEIALHYRLQLVVMKAARARGVVGRLEFVSWI